MESNGLKRRQFLKLSAAAGGGMLLGISWLVSCKNDVEVAPHIIEMPDDWYEMNAFLKIGNNGVVTIFSQNPEIGQNVKTSMPMIVAEELDIDWKNVIVEQAGLNTDKFPRQVAGGSQSIRQGWETLRKAGATARHLLVKAAAEKWEIDPSKCRTEDGVIYGTGDLKMGYGEVASIAAEMEIPEDVPLKEKTDFKIIGQGKGNVDLDDIVTGKPLFGIDTKREGMLYASVVRPPAFGQKLASFDDTEARKVNGVKDVFKFGDKIAVVANSTWQAMKAKKLIKANYTENSKAESTEGHDKKMMALLETSPKEYMREDGDVKKAFAEADEVVSRTYESPFLPHNCMEPMNFFADATGGKVIMHGPIQTPAWGRSRAAKILGKEETDIDVTMSRMGGGFGRRLYGDFSDEAAEISSLAKAPIQLTFTREDDMTAGTYRPAIKYKIEASLKDGAITGYRLTEAAINSNMYGLIPNFFPAGAIPNLQISGQKYDSNITTGAWRAPYTNFLAFAEQSFFDELAGILKKDEIELRLELLEQAKPAAEKDEKIEYSPARMQACIRLARDKSNWGKDTNVYQGISAYYSHNTHVAEVADVEMRDGVPVITKVTCAVDCGIVINPEGARNQIEGGIIDGIGHAMYGELTFDKGKPSSQNFDSFRMIRNSETPLSIDVHFVESDIDPTGLGEPSLPPAGGAVANALFKATGKRLYKQPFVKEIDILG